RRRRCRRRRARRRAAQRGDGGPDLRPRREARPAGRGRRPGADDRGCRDHPAQPRGPLQPFQPPGRRRAQRMNRILASAGAEFRIALRNRWVAIAVAMMALFSMVLAAAGSAPTGALGADRLSVTVASLTSLAVYLVPLMALLMSFDAVAGEVERGTLPLMLTYPVARWEILLGKLLAHLAILTLAIVAGYGAAAVAAIATDPRAAAGLPALWRLTWTSVMLGATFLCAGYALSSLARRPSGAAGLAIGLWLGLVVLYDLGLLAAIVADNGGIFTTRIF